MRSDCMPTRESVGDSLDEVNNTNIPETLRDEIAMRALYGMLAHPTRYQPRPGAPAHWHDAIAAEAYELADAMIRARLTNG